MKSVATRKCKIPPVICIIFQLNSTGVGHALEFSNLKTEETGYVILLAPNHHWPNTALEGVCGCVWGEANSLGLLLPPAEQCPSELERIPAR